MARKVTFCVALLSEVLGQGHYSMFCYNQKSRCLTQSGGCWLQETKLGYKDPVSWDDGNSPYVISDTMTWVNAFVRMPWTEPLQAIIHVYVYVYMYIYLPMYFDFHHPSPNFPPLWTLPPPVLCLLPPQLVPFCLPTTYILLLSLLPTSLMIFSFLIKISLLVHDPLTYLNIHIYTHAYVILSQRKQETFVFLSLFYFT